MLAHIIYKKIGKSRSIKVLGMDSSSSPAKQPVGFWYLFCSDWREAFLISWGYGMGDPMAPSDSEGGGK